MRFRQFREIQPIPLQLAPMIDILFLLLIFFIITWNSARRETEIEISVPAADAGVETKRKSVGEIVVNVRKGGEIVVEGEKLTEEQLLTKLRLIAQVYKDQAVILRGDEKSEYQKVMNVLNTCQKAGIWNVSFATRPPEEEGATAPPVVVP
ncbi:MAG: biopolymer transporter ExbD [Verrucomicrobiaceae bacterium]